MTKRLIHVLIILALILAVGASYLSAIILPVKINMLVIEELERAGVIGR